MNLPFNPFWYFQVPYMNTGPFPNQFTPIPPTFSMNYTNILQSSSTFQSKPTNRAVNMENTIDSASERVQLERKRSDQSANTKKKIVKKKKDENFGWRKQNKDRNLISDILKEYPQAVMNHPKMEIIIERVIDKFNFQTDVSSFKKFVQRKFPIKKSYVGLNFTKNVLVEAKNEEDKACILRVTLCFYLRELYPLMALHNSELLKKHQMTHLKKAKSIASMLFDK